MQKIEFLKYQIDQHKVIFFDVFDTLIKRAVPKEKDVFRLVEMRYDKKFNTTSRFLVKRITAEKKARIQGEYREVNLDEIYNFLDVDSETANIFKSMELEAEFDVCIANEPLYQIFQYCLMRHKKIYIVSDMYLSAQQIDKLLHINGYAGYCRIYSSCDVRLTKWEQGELYNKIISTENLKHSDILHIGNDKIADFNKAKQQGIDAFLVIEKKNYSKHYQCSIRDFTYQCMELFIGNEQIRQDNYFRRLGFEIFGPIIYGFTQWLVKQCKKQDLKKVFFFSRDGYLLKKSFDLMHTGITTNYFYISRKSVIRPVLQFDSSYQETLEHYKSWDRSFSWEYLFHRYEIPEDVYQPILNALHLRIDVNLNKEKLFKDSAVREVFKRLHPFLINNSIRQLALFQKYMSENGFCDSVGIVDMGAGCSIELALNELLTKTSSAAKPYYLYVHTPLEENFRRKKYLDSGDNNIKLHSLLRFCYMFLEIILAAPHGTVSGYASKDNRVVPILEENEYNIPFANTTEKQVIDWLQQGALEFVEQFHQRFGKYFDLSEDVVLAGFKNFGMTPLSEDVLFWKDFKILLDGYIKIIKDENPHSYIMYPRLFLQDMMNSIWPSGFFMKHIPSRNVMQFIYNIYLMIKRINQ